MKRDKITIMHDMMHLIRSKNNNAKPTHIMYKANLSHEMLTEYLTELKKKDFVVETIDKESRRTYSLTDKGLKFLQDYEQMKRFLTAYDLGS